MPRVDVVWTRPEAAGGTGPVDHHDLAHALLTSVAGRTLGVPAAQIEVTHRCRVCGGAHGKPYLRDHPDLHVSIAHCVDLVVVALTRVGPVGVDVEPEGAGEFEGFDQVALAASERAETGQRTLLWTRKEAVLKASGHGLSLDPAGLVVTAADQPAALIDGTIAGLEPAEVRMLDLDLPEHHIGCVAVLTPRPFEVHIREATPAIRGAVEAPDATARP